MNPPEEHPVGIDPTAVTSWLRDVLHQRGEDLTPPLRFDQIAGGRSNLTYHVTDAEGRAWALRRPPTGNVLATAHDMTREHRVMSALHPTPVPVPEMIGLCEDIAVNDAPFYVMEWVDGTVVRSSRIAEEFPVKVRRNMGVSTVEALALIHAVDIDEVGLGDFAKREGYIERQLRRWKKQVDASSMPTIPELDEAFDRLSARIPEQGTARLVHGDFRLDNAIVDDEGTVIAVLDWELTTLGDPMADLGAMLTYWSRPGDPTVALTDPPTLADGFIDRDEVVAIYERASGRSVGDVNYYQSFATWRLACILDGVVDRYRAGAMGRDDGFDSDDWAAQVAAFAQQSLALLEDR
jgi:aminoglycoside phosphotransferase (APT) family kinase protein